MLSKDQNETGQLLTEGQVARLLNVSIRTMQGWRLRGGGPRYIKVSSGAVRYRPRDITSFLDARTFASTSEERLA